MIIDVITINNVYMCERAHHGPLNSVKFDQPLAAQRQRDTFSFFLERFVHQEFLFSF